ncbi:hypothetical protein [Turicibacter sanguinis]|uniref:hypothetical protein n=1 Tax=Turicibacter sanguinis TaxID=154288 RepID=UPI0018AAB3E7|nr:hypothetical protein [Turicibacter sanguinis]MDB8559600.1 hypothetical protein [Turicibacter sanguinis]MDB8561053.1 hypothetical protein [Turicibacter sanguinis]
MERESNFELLRIVAIMMVIGLHYFNGSMGGALSILTHGDGNFYLAYFFESLFIIAVNLFVLVCGYFNIDKKKTNLLKLFNLIVIAYFYGFIWIGYN